MSLNDIAVNFFTFNQHMVDTLLADLSDADLLVRPVPKANHANWQLGHVILSETRIVGPLPKAPAFQLPPNFAELYKKDKAASDDAASFLNKAQLLDAFHSVRGATINWLKTLTADDVAAPAQLFGRPSNVGAAILLLPTHLAMHIGQIQVLRRKLDKPVLF